MNNKSNKKRNIPHHGVSSRDENQIENVSFIGFYDGYFGFEILFLTDWFGLEITLVSMQKKTG